MASILREHRRELKRRAELGWRSSRESAKYTREVALVCKTRVQSLCRLGSARGFAVTPWLAQAVAAECTDVGWLPWIA
jgi:hypothetical protein